MIFTDKIQLKKLKKLSRSELLEVMLALKRENDILLVENVRLKTLKHKLENDLREITETLRQIDRSFRGEVTDPYGETSDTYEFVEEASLGTFDGMNEPQYGSGSEFESISASDSVTKEATFESVFDSYTDEVTNK